MGYTIILSMGSLAPRKNEWLSPMEYRHLSMSVLVSSSLVTDEINKQNNK